MKLAELKTSLDGTSADTTRYSAQGQTGAGVFRADDTNGRAAGVVERDLKEGEETKVLEMLLESHAMNPE